MCLEDSNKQHWRPGAQLRRQAASEHIVDIGRINDDGYSNKQRYCPSPQCANLDILKRRLDDTTLSKPSTTLLWEASS